MTEFLEVTMAEDLKAMYRTVMDYYFPPQLTISFGD